MVALNQKYQNYDGGGTNNVCTAGPEDFDSWLFHLLQSMEHIANRLKAADRQEIQSLLALKTTLTDQLVVASLCDNRVRAQYAWKKNNVLLVVVNVFDSFQKTYKIPFRSLGLNASQLLQEHLGSPN